MYHAIFDRKFENSARVNRYLGMRDTQPHQSSAKPAHDIYAAACSGVLVWGIAYE